MSNLLILFPKIDDYRNIDTFKFIEASKCILSIVDKMYGNKSEIRKDIHTNILKIENRFLNNPKMNSTLQDMVHSEKEERDNTATIGLLWLNRTIYFMELFLQRWDIELRSVKQSLESAYISVYKRHHSKFSRLFFKVQFKMISESDLERVLKKIKKDNPTISMQSFIGSIEPNRTIIQRLLKDYY